MKAKNAPPVAVRHDPAVDIKVVMVPIENLAAWAGNPRQRFEEEGLQELAASIQAEGLLSPLIVRPVTCPYEIEEGRCYQVIAGGRRLRAARIAGLDAVPCSVRDVDELQALFIAITENAHRTDIDPLEIAKSYQRVQVMTNLSQSEIARRLNKSASQVSAFFGLLDLPEDVQRLVGARSLSLSHIKALRRFNDFPPVLSRIAELAAENGTSSHELETISMPFGFQLTKEGVALKLSKYEGYQSKRQFPECAGCPWGALRNLDNYDSVCLKPEHWQELEDARVEAAKLEAARSLEKRMAVKDSMGDAIALAAERRGLPDAPTAERVAEEIDRIRHGADEPVDDAQEEVSEEVEQEIAVEKPRIPTFDDLAGGFERIFDLAKRPSGCDDDCRCLLKVFDVVTGRVQPVCLDGERYRRLQLEEGKAKSKDRKILFNEIRARIVDTPLQEGYHATVVMLAAAWVAGCLRDARLKYLKELEGTDLLASMPESFRALLARENYIAGGERDLFVALASMDAETILLHARNLELFSALEKAQQYKQETPSDVCRILGITPDGASLDDTTARDPDRPDVAPWLRVIEASEYESVAELLDEKEIDDVACERCHRLVPQHALGSPPSEEQRFLEGDPERERLVTRLETGVLAINLLSTGDVFYYCPNCGPGVVWCRNCGCTQEMACPEGCSWVEADLCSECADVPAEVVTA